MKKIIAMIAAFAIVMMGLVAITSPASASDHKVTICHAAGLAGTTKYKTLSVGERALRGHFDEQGTPLAGHEQDYMGACQDTGPGEKPADESSSVREFQPNCEAGTLEGRAKVTTYPYVLNEDETEWVKGEAQVTYTDWVTVRDLTDSEKKRAGCEVVTPVKDPTTTSKREFRANCEDGTYEGRAVKTTTTYTWNAETQQFDVTVGEPVPGDWKVLRDLTDAEKVRAGCEIPEEPEGPTELATPVVPKPVPATCETGGSLTVAPGEGYTTFVSRGERSEKVVATKTYNTPGDYVITFVAGPDSVFKRTGTTRITLPAITVEAQSTEDCDEAPVKPKALVNVVDTSSLNCEDKTVTTVTTTTTTDWVLNEAGTEYVKATPTVETITVTDPATDKLCPPPVDKPDVPTVDKPDAPKAEVPVAAKKPVAVPTAVAAGASVLPNTGAGNYVLIAAAAGVLLLAGWILLRRRKA